MNRFPGEPGQSKYYSDLDELSEDDAAVGDGWKALLGRLFTLWCYKTGKTNSMSLKILVL